MPIKLSDLKAKTATVNVYEELGMQDKGIDLNVTYHLVDAPSQKQVEAYQVIQSQDVEKMLEVGADAIVSRVVEWDLMGDDGKPLPITSDVLKNQVPNSLITDIANAINSHRRPKKSEGAAS